jgi:hypothetical protein
MIENNVEILKQQDWNELTRDLTVRTSKDKKTVRYLNVMVDQNSGQILAVSKNIRVFKDMVTLTIALQRRHGPLPFKLEFASLNYELPKAIKSILQESFEQFNSIS